MNTLLRFSGTKALPAFGTSTPKKQEFFSAALALLNAGEITHLDIDYSMQKDHEFDEKQDDTVLWIDIQHKDPKYFLGKPYPESTIWLVELLRDHAKDVDLVHDEKDDTDNGTKRRFISVKLVLAEAEE
ncbi:hypothetical protein [Flavobacterium psychrotrophum]|uniref:hypothetical protein n=1 Tax=Flavobacterium psychrotrophum TaxID=2294119 RepID=UPI000E314D72|nr:hypothetical protein [Flavobacterium psychrotrophum]